MTFQLKPYQLKAKLYEGVKMISFINQNWLAFRDLQVFYLGF
jgi:hypothetical protein